MKTQFLRIICDLKAALSKFFISLQPSVIALRETPVASATSVIPPWPIAIATVPKAKRLGRWSAVEFNPDSAGNLFK